jgi:hypothetical protein
VYPFTSAAITSFGIEERRAAKRPFSRVRYCFSTRLCDVLLDGHEGLVVRSWRDVDDRWCDADKRRWSLFDVLARLECFPAPVVVGFEFLEDLRDFFGPLEAGLHCDPRVEAVRVRRCHVVGT